MNLSNLHRILGRGIHKHRMIESYSIHTCRDHRWNARKRSLGVVFYADNETCHVVSTGHISPDDSSFPCNQLFAGFVRILPVVSISICGRIKSFRQSIRHLLGCQQCRLTFILRVRGEMELPTLRLQLLC